MNLKQADISFVDVRDTHWAKRYIEIAVAHKWVSEYEDATFRQEQKIIRVEAMIIINIILSRGVGEHGLGIKWTDK